MMGATNPVGLLSKLGILSAGAATSYGFSLVVENLIERHGFSIWSNDLYVTLAYGVLMLSSAFAPVLTRRNAKATLTTIALLLVVAGFLGFASGQGVASAVELALVFLGCAWLVRILYGKLEPSAGEGVFFSLTSSLLFAFLLTAGVGTIYVLETMPSYAEGFVILTWVLLGTFHLLIALVAFTASHFLGPRGKNQGTPVRPAPLAIVLVLGSTIPLATVYQMIRVEGELAGTLESSGDWSDAFQALPEASAQEPQETVDPLFTKNDVAKMLEAQTDRSMAHLGTLYFLTKDRKWAEIFRARLLEEVAQEKFTGPAHSVKYVQRTAMIRGMFYLELKRVLPDLFSTEQQSTIDRWFTDITRRIFTVEWVDLLYAIPFRIDPEGPYLNQEIGAAALAVFSRIISGPAPDLAEKARDFTARLGVGWRGNFRNLDDSFEYQDIWMGSAFSMMRYADGMDQEKNIGIRSALHWIKSQIPMDSIPIGYGLPYTTYSIDSLAIAAFLLNDRQARRLLDQQLLDIRETGDALPKGPTALWLWNDDVRPAKFSPRSELIFGPSGLSFRPGRLRPDKIVMRSNGSEPDDELFALVGLRNTGWHRYPATNTLIRLKFGRRSLVAEDIVSKKHYWLPAGRSGHRDKKVDRIRLNGLLVSRTGFDSWVGGVTGVYSRWRQDVPRYGSVSLWASAGDLQVAKVAVDDWDGVAQERTYIASGDSEFLVVDDVLDTQSRDKAIQWNLVGFEPLGKGRYVNRMASEPDIVFDAIHDARSSIVANPARNFYPSAYPDAIVDQRVAIESGSRSLRTVGMFRVARDGSRDLAAVPGRITEEGLVVIPGEGAEFIVAGRGQWAHGGIESDARVVRVEKQDESIRLAIIGGSFARIACPASRCNGVQVDHGRDPDQVLDEDGSLLLRWNQEASAVLSL